MVKIGSGGATFAKGKWNDADYIIDRLPLAQANQFIQIYWALQKKPDGRGIACWKPTAVVGESTLQTVIQ